MKLQITARPEISFLIALQELAAGTQAIVSISRHLFGKDSTVVHGVPGAGLIAEVEVNPPSQVETEDPLTKIRELFRLAVHALRVAKSEGCRRCPHISVKWFSIDADNARAGAILDGNLLLVNSTISSIGFMQKVRSDLSQLLLVDCSPRLLPELEPGETWSDILEPTLAVGSETRSRTCVVTAHDALTGSMTVSELGNRTVGTKVKGSCDQIDRLMAGYSCNRALRIDFTENGEPLLRREKYQLVGWEWLGEQQELFARPVLATADDTDSGTVP
jgi:hypothetical protein